ncbi:hypothetical protein KJF94_15985 [Pseudomonas hormoni]|uniref:DNA packaging protein n=1 Tax=Pseudomonas hormoni TaxID=3093767 RepID=A0ABX8ET69_9PSED|nr:hypothetical protein [Pseudomonas hormoni]QVW21413.1 hypothetical protein KJF94_15985 [Pseudomonas hormoni]
MHDLLERLLEALDTEKGQFMLQDMRDPEKRSPQLYNAVEKYLDRHKFTIAKLRPNASLLGELASSLDDVRDLTDDELYGTTH